MTSWTTAIKDSTGFDLETTGTDVEQDRIVTASIVSLTDAGRPNTREWLINPGIDIPVGATEVHGITTEHARENGQDPAEALHDLVCLLAMGMATGSPLAGMNLAFDLTILDRECRRHGIPTLGQRLAAERGTDDENIHPVIDIMLVDKAMDKYRKGGRKLVDLCNTYGVRLDDAHQSTGDVLGTLRVVWKMAHLATSDADTIRASYGDRWLREPATMVRWWQRLGALTLDQLHDAQVGWAREQDESFKAFQTRRAAELRANLAGLSSGEIYERTMTEIEWREGMAASATGEWPLRQIPAQRQPGAGS